MNRKLVYLARHLDIFHRRTPPRLQRIVGADRKYYRQDLRHIRRDYRWTTAPRICGLGNISWPLLPDDALPSCIAILLPPLLSSSSRCPGRRMVFRSREEAREGRLNWKYVIRQCVKSSVSFRILLQKRVVFSSIELNHRFQVGGTMFRGLINFLHISLPLPLFQHRSESIRRVRNRKIYSSIVLNTPESDDRKNLQRYTLPTYGENTVA